MLKFTETEIGFREVPGEISLCINISGCPCHCKNCHSSYLAEDVGKILDKHTLKTLINENQGISCVAFMGHGSLSNLKIIKEFISIIHNMNLKVALYSGFDNLKNNELIKDLDYLKEGPYIEECGPLNCPTTNQKFYKKEKEGFKNITNSFWENKLY